MNYYGISRRAPPQRMALPTAFPLGSVMGRRLKRTKVDAARFFDSPTGYATRGAGLTGAVDSKSGILSVWYRPEALTGTTRPLLTGGTGGSPIFTLQHNSAQDFRLQGQNAATATILDYGGRLLYPIGIRWLHLLFSWDLAINQAQCFINDVDERGSVLATNDTLDYTLPDWSIGAFPPGTAPQRGNMAELYFAPGQWLDFSITDNRRKFISASREPVFLGVNGQYPTGLSPILYQGIRKGEPVENFVLDRSGSGNTMTITGELTRASTSPSD